LADSLKKEEL